MRRLAIAALLTGGIGESVLVACFFFGGGIGPCGPGNPIGYIGLLGHLPVMVVQELAGSEFTNTTLFLVNAALIALFAFLGACFVHVMRRWQ